MSIPVEKSVILTCPKCGISKEFDVIKFEENPELVVCEKCNSKVNVELRAVITTRNN